MPLFNVVCIKLSPSFPPGWQNKSQWSNFIYTLRFQTFPQKKNAATQIEPSGRQRLLVGRSAHIFHRQAPVGTAAGDVGSSIWACPYGRPIWTTHVQTGSMWVQYGQPIWGLYRSYMGPRWALYGGLYRFITTLCKSDGFNMGCIWALNNIPVIKMGTIWDPLLQTEPMWISVSRVVTHTWLEESKSLKSV